MSTATLTLAHVVLSLVGIGSGSIVLFGLLTSKRLAGWTAIFLTTTVATSATGFLFPYEHVTPGIILGAISLVVLAVAILARYAFHLAGAWRGIYVVSALLALYLNVFVAVFQAFMKIPPLKALAPTQKEAPFLVAQLVVLAAFIGLTIAAARRFQLGPARAV